MPFRVDEIRRQIENPSYRLFLRCHGCSSMGVVKFQHKNQFTFLSLPQEPKIASKTQWLFQTICRECKESAHFALPNTNFISIDQLIQEMSAECVLITLHDDSVSFV
jgi:nickel-dependent lactate racemase